MKLSKNNQTVVNRLRKENLTYLIIPFLKMVELDRLGKIRVHKMSWKVIMREVYDEGLERFEIENMIISYLVNFGIVVVKKKVVDKRKSKERVAKHRTMKKELGYKTISVNLSPDDYEQVKRLKKLNNVTYNELFELFLHNPKSLKFM